MMAVARASAAPSWLLPFPCAANPQDRERRCVRACGVPATVAPEASLTLAAVAKQRAPCHRFGRPS